MGKRKGIVRRLIEAVWPRASTGETRWWEHVLASLGYDTTPTAAGMSIDSTTAMTIAAVYRAVSLLSDSMMVLPLAVYRRTSETERGIARNHPLYRVLHDEANPETHAGRFRRLMQTWKLLWGNAYAEIEIDVAGNVVRLWPIHPSRVDRTRKAGDPYKVLRDVVIGPDNSTTTKVVTIPLSRMLHLQNISTDGISGLSVIGCARQSLGLTVAAERYGARFFGNNSRPSVVLESELQALEKEERDALRKEWAEIYGGENQNGTAVLWGGLKAHTLSIPNEDSQFLQTRQFQVVEVARWFGVPPHKLYELGRATWNNTEQMGIDFAQDSLLPHVKDWEFELNRKLFLPAEQAEYFAEFNMLGVMRADSNARGAYYRNLWGIGAMSANEIRALENQNGQGAAGDRYYVPVNMQPADAKTTTVNLGKQTVAAAEARARTVVTLSMTDALTRLVTRFRSRLEARTDFGKPTFAVWLTEALESHGQAARVTLATSVEQYAAMMREWFSGESLTEWDRRVGAATATIAAMHCRHVDASVQAKTDIDISITSIMDALASAFRPEAKS